MLGGGNSSISNSDRLMDKRKEWQKVLLGFVAMLLLVFVADCVVGFAFEKAYRNSKYGIFHRQEYCLHESKDEILIFGSSRAAHHYVPQIFTDSLGMSCYNCGSDGECIYYHYGILSSYIQRGDIPKIVLLDITKEDAVAYDGASFNLDAAIERFAPNYGEYVEIDSLILLNGWNERVKLFSKCYRYNSKAVQLVKCNFIPWPENQGYEAVFGELSDTTSLRNIKYKNEKIEQEKIVYFNKFIKACKDNNIQLYIIESPSYIISSSVGIDTLMAIAKANNIMWLDYKNQKEMMRKEYFRDLGHLNDSGAHIFSSIIANDIKKKYSD